MATQEVLDACDNRGLQACVVHPSGILGPDDHAISETTGTVIRIMNGEKRLLRSWRSLFLVKGYALVIRGEGSINIKPQFIIR